jgi:hypothetical protein
MAKVTMYEILEAVEKASTEQDKINILRQNHSRPFADLLQGALDARIKWLLPEGPVPFKPNKGEGLELIFWAEIRKLYLFVENGNPNLSQFRRESLFVQLLEAIDPRDAKLLEYVKDKKLPFPSVTYELLQKAYGIDYPKATPQEIPVVEEKKAKVASPISWDDTPPVMPLLEKEVEKQHQFYKEIDDDAIVNNTDKVTRRKEMRKIAAAKRKEKKLGHVQNETSA